MREIKFRAWDEKIKTMFGWEVVKDFRLGIFEEPFFVDNLDKHYLEFMQFTGLLDKNGKEIYEGDILKGWIPDSESDSYVENGMVKFYEGAFDINNNIGYIGDLSSCCLNDSIEIIGNIYENKNLIK